MFKDRITWGNDGDRITIIRHPGSLYTLWREVQVPWEKAKQGFYWEIEEEQKRLTYDDLVKYLARGRDMAANGEELQDLYSWVLEGMERGQL